MLIFVGRLRTAFPDESNVNDDCVICIIVLTKLLKYPKFVVDYFFNLFLSCSFNSLPIFFSNYLNMLQETVQAILEIKFSNIIVEILVEEKDALFKGGEKSEKMEGEVAAPKIASKPSIAKLPSQKYVI